MHYAQMMSRFSYHVDLWDLLNRLESVAGAMVSQLSGSDVALNIIQARQRKNAATRPASITANTVVVYIKFGLSFPNNIGTGNKEAIQPATKARQNAMTAVNARNIGT